MLPAAAASFQDGHIFLKNKEPATERRLPHPHFLYLPLSCWVPLPSSPAYLLFSQVFPVLSKKVVFYCCYFLSSLHIVVWCCVCWLACVPPPRSLPSALHPRNHHLCLQCVHTSTRAYECICFVVVTTTLVSPGGRRRHRQGHCLCWIEIGGSISLMRRTHTSYCSLFIVRAVPHNTRTRAGHRTIPRGIVVVGTWVLCTW